MRDSLSPAAESACQNRRQWLRLLAVAVPGINPSATFSATQTDSSPRWSFPTGARERLAVTSYPFRSIIDSPTNPARDHTRSGMDLKEFPRMVAERFGVFNINPVGDHFASTDAAYLRDLRQAIAAAKSHIVDLGISGRDFSHPDEAVRAESIAWSRKWIDIARTVGSPSIRQHLKTTAGAELSVERTAQCLGELAEYGAQQGIVVNLENDSPGAEDPLFIAAVLKKAHQPFLRALPDFGNSLRGHDQTYNEKAVGQLFHFAWNMSHVKAILAEKSGPPAHVDVGHMFAIARAHSYRGYFSMEFDTAVGDPFTGTQELIEQSLHFLA